MAQRHKHADVIIAWAEGKDVQVRDEGTKHWYDIRTRFPIFSEDREHRIKPPPPKYRVALFKDTFSNNYYTGTADTTEDANFCEKDSVFICWLTDWVEYQE